MINQGFKLHCFIIGSDTMYIQEQNEKETEVLKPALALNLTLWGLPIWGDLFGTLLLHLLTVKHQK